MGYRINISSIKPFDFSTKLSKVDRFSLEERYDYQNRKVIYDRDADSDIELNNIYPIIDQLNNLDKQIEQLKQQLAIAEKALELVCSDAHGIAIECEGYYFGACSEKTFNWFEDLSKEEKIKAHCNYFLNKAKEMLEDESK